MLLGKEENASLDKLIHKFLALVSPHLLHSSAFKALEWLIKRFRIQEFNIDGLIRCALPFHDTWQFTRVLSVIKLTGKWSWLSAQKEKKVSLDRSTLVQRLKIDIALVEFICDMMEKLLVPGTSNASLSSFFTGTMVEFINSVKFNDDLMRIIMPRLFIMAAVELPNIQAAAYMIMSHLSNQVPFSSEVVGAMTDVIVDRASGELGKFAGCCLVSIYDAQENTPKISVEALGTLLRKDGMWKEVLGEVLKVYQGDALTLVIIYSFFQQRKQNNCISTYDDFVEFVHHLTLTAPLAERLCAFILEDALSGNAHEDISPIKKLLVLISKSYPLVVNKSIASVSKSTKEKVGADKVFELISSAFIGTAHEPLSKTSTTLYLSLQHADAEIRYYGYERLIAILRGKQLTAASTLVDKDLSFVPQTFAAGLVDSNPKVRSLVASIPNLIEFLELLPNNEGVKALYELVNLSRLSHNAAAKSAFDNLIKLDYAEYSEARDIAMSYFLLSKETVGLFVHASNTVKNGPPLLASLFEGAEALGKEILSAEKAHAGKNVEFDKVVDNVFGRVPALVAANVMKDETGNALYTILETLSSTNGYTRLLSILILSQIVESPQYSIKLFTVSTALLAHIKAKLNVSTLQSNTLAKAPTTVFSLKSSSLQSLEETLLLSALTVIVSSLPRLRKQEVAVAAIDYHNGIEKDVFEVIMSLRKVHSCHTLIGNFFDNHLKADSLPFLANLSLSHSATEETQAQCLRMITMVLSADVEAKVEAKDYQVLVPILLVALSRHNKIVREQAIKCLETIQLIQDLAVNHGVAKKSAPPVFAFDTFHGVSSNKVKFLQSALTQKFLAAILETSQELISDSSYIFRRLGDVLFKKALDNSQSDNVLTFLLTTVLAIQTTIGKQELLSTLKAVQVPQKVKILQPLFDTIFGNGESVNSCVSEHELMLRFAMIDCFNPTVVSNVFGYRSGRFLSLFLRIIATGDEREAIHALGLVSPGWFDKVEAHHQAVFTSLVQIASKSTKDVAFAAKKAIKNVTVGADVVLNIISVCKASIGDEDDMQQQMKKARTDRDSLSGINELITVLELLDSTSNITSKENLVGPLFELLGFVLPLESSKIPVSLEYLKQLLITAKLNIIRSLKQVGSTVDESIIRVDLIVSCIRVSDNPQTHNEALLLLAELAEVYPNTVLVNVVPIFTFMGANVLRRDDDYSFHVIQQTLEAIIPPLIKKSKLSAKKLDVRSIIEVFIDSIFHIPRHRRLRLFTILVSTLGPIEFLDSVIMMLLLKSSQRFSDIAMANPSDIASLSPFCLSLIQQFDAVVQFKAVVGVTEAVQRVPNEADSYSEVSIGSISLDLRSFASNEIRHFKLVSLDFVNNVLGTYVEGDQSRESLDVKTRDSLFHSLFHTTLVIIVEALGTKSLEQAAESKNSFYRSLAKRLNSILSHLNHLMSFTSFFELALSLLAHNDISIRVRVTDLTRTKLEEVDAAIYTENDEVIKAVFQQLSSTISDEIATENIGLKLSTFECINSMIVKFAENDPQAFAAILPILTDDSILLSDSRPIRLASLECVGSSISKFGPRVIPFIKKIMNAIFDVLKVLRENLSVDELCVAALSCADLAVSVMPQFLSPFISEILQSMFLPYDQLTGVKEVLSKFRNSKRDIATNISKKIPVRTLIPILATHVQACFKLGASATLELFEVSSMTISNMEKGDLTVFLNDLVKFFLSSFEFRKKYHNKYSESDIDKVEGSIISAFLQLVLRLNESHFKPMFFKIVDWAFNENGGKENVLFLYRLVVSLLDKLKTIFSPYVLHLVDHSIELLNGYKLASEVDKKWDLIMSALNKFLQYSSGPVTEDVFNKLTKCLTGQIDLVTVHGRSYLAHMTRHVVPTIGLLAVNIAKEPMWKILNKEIMKKSRNEDVLSRIVTIKCLQEFYVHLGEEFLILLPETVPTIAELMEDGDERIQVACQELSAEIQKHLGEDLNSYFS
ncbi:HEAT repeat-containing protein 1 [Rhizoclosmatium sp. JEL0117]|nr:HEAT repeat-containing protein 1 [Rhizoclosmatium sp. JEL0117]